MNRFVAIPRLAAILLVFAAYTAHAQYEVAEIPFYYTPPGTAALGGGLRLGQDLYFATDNEDQRQFDLVPLYLYNGKYVFFRGSAGGVHLVNSDHFELNALGRYRFTKLDPDRNAFYDGINERKQTLEGGLEVRLRGNWGALNANYLTDTLDRHTGQSAEISYRYRFDRGSLSFSPFISWAWNSDKLANYYFGVSDSEARPDLPAYAPGEAQWVSFGLNTTWWVTDRTQLFAFGVGYDVDTVLLDALAAGEVSSMAAFVELAAQHEVLTIA